ncbi:MAG TPA: M1 family metallopeptidase [Flavobacterium sp.]|uniref:M1 family metallopeptidase n=1 Tax=Flavobacterium sp. TaxID=239 RepID=UPI002DBB4AE6|nr:M1 family metallopeptidase [Flavobacterium sp.]HEU4791441.1 M1 family metallopeptidase [Flavobacterium sp.]
MRVFSFSILACLMCTVSHAQTFTRQDSLRGTITNERVWWDLSYYHLDIAVDIDKQTVQGSNTIKYKVLKPNQIIQIDLQPPMDISKVTQEGKELKYTRDGNAYYIELQKKQVPGTSNEIIVQYGGKPKIAPKPPWDSGLVWKKDSLDNPFVSSISWGAGSSQWWPCKDHMYDEVDSLKFSINVRKGLMAVANGRLIKTEQKKNNTTTYHWFVKNPINNYGVNFNIANYANFSEIYNGEKGPLNCNYYVLKQNLSKAKEHFKQVPMMLKAFEHWFGPYPFYEDSYKLVEVPYIGMEHQSATAYGNGYKNGHLGKDKTQTGWGKKFDDLIIHESAHEWFACNITFRDIADIWIHESFTSYAEGLYVEYHYGKEAGDEYQIALRRFIKNEKTMIGHYEVNDLAYTGDNYYKGAAILHMLRQLVNDDEKWRQILRGLNIQFYHQTVTTKQIEDYITEKSGLNLKNFWDQYLRTTQIPVFEYSFANNLLSYRWTNSIAGFDMPLKIKLNGEEKWIYPKTDWQKDQIKMDKAELVVDRNFYVPIFYDNPK